MPNAGWMHRRLSRHGVEEHLKTPVLAAARGEPLSQLLNLGTQALLAAAGADRAGLWLLAHRGGTSSAGCVSEAVPGPIPEQWKYLDLTAPFLRELLETSEPLHLQLPAGAAVPRLGPLIAMRSAVWIPLRERGRTFGLAMVGYARPPGKLDLNELRARADEIAVAVQHSFIYRRSEQAAEERRAESRILRAIASGVSLDFIFAQIARAARRFLQAEFVAIGEGNKPPLAGEGWDGAEAWLAALQQGDLLRLWRKVLKEGRDLELPGETLVPLALGIEEASHSTLERVVALPIETRGVTAGVLLAGFRWSEASADDYAHLESYALVAGAALDREAVGRTCAAFHDTLRRLIEESHEGLIVIDGEGRIQEVSRAAAGLFLTPRGRREATLLDELFSPLARDAVADWRERLRAHPGASARMPVDSLPPVLEAELNRGGVIRMQFREEITGLGAAGPRWLISVEHRGAQDALREAKERLEVELAGLLDSIESGVLILDAEGRTLVASERLAAIFGFEPSRLREFGAIDELIASLTYQFLRPAETASRWREHVRQGDAASYDEFELVQPSRKIVERFARPLFQPDGARLGWLEVYRDITGQRLIQSKLIQTEKMAALGQLVSGIAHELNNPLTSIQGYAQLLLTRRSAADRAGDAMRISQEAERAGRIVKNLLLFSRETKSERHPVQLNEVIERTLSLRSYELKLENIEVELALDSGLPQTLADGAQLQQVVLNLLVNAEQAIVMARGEEPPIGRILIRTRRLPGDRLSMEVSDDGPGIAAEIIGRIFDPFFTTKPPGIGTGLGLSIVYGIVQEHGGEVSVDSLPGRGTTLIVELPALSVSGFNLMRVEPAKPAQPFEIGSGRVLPRTDAREHILVVEDEPTVAELITDVMTEEGHRVETLLDSRAALRRLEEKSYSLVICDLKMPYVDGPGLYRALVRRANPMQDRLLFVTGDTMGTRTLEFLKSSGLPYLAKPFLVEELKAAVRQSLAAAPKREETASGEERSRTAAWEQG